MGPLAISMPADAAYATLYFTNATCLADDGSSVGLVGVVIRTPQSQTTTTTTTTTTSTTSTSTTSTSTTLTSVIPNTTTGTTPGPGAVVCSVLPELAKV